MPAGSTIEGLGSVDDPVLVRRRRWLHRVISAVLAAVIAVAVLDGLDVVDLLGPDEARVRAEGGGYSLEVEHPSITRPALASVFRISVRRAGGFGDEPVQVAVSRHYLESFDLNGVLPATSGEVSSGRWIIWEFDPPPGDELLITYEARIEPGVQRDRHGEVAVMVDDEPVTSVSFTTTVRP